MADIEPPPMDDENTKEENGVEEDEDLNPFGDPEEEPKKEEKTKIPVDVKIDDDKDDDEEDLFSGGGTEVKLDSDEGDSDPVTVKEAPAPSQTLDNVNLFEEEEDKSPEAQSEPQPELITPITAEEERKKQPELDVSQTTTTVSTRVSTRTSSKDSDKIEESPHTINISVTEPHKIGDGMGAYIVYKVITKTTIPVYKRQEMIVIRRFSDFLGLHEKLRDKHAHMGRIVPPAPEKSLVGMTKVKMSKEESGSSDFLERRRAALERFMNRTANHPVLVNDPDFREFLERDGELPKATNTSALSGAGVKRFLSKIGDSVEKITFKMEETDEWFEEKQQQIENLDTQLKKLHGAMENLVNHRKDLGNATGIFAKSAAMLGAAEEHTALSRALSQLAECEEKVEQLQQEQSDQDFYVMAELLKDYIALLGSVKDVLHERVKTYKNWKEAEATLTKKRETKVKLELARKTEKISQAQQEITDWEQRVEKGQRDFEAISATVRKEVARFDKVRVTDFKTSVIIYLQNLMEKQQQAIRHWEQFLPEAKAIA